jgi:Kdo2-lipid IVA lauroyltransferase/acyltransferase
MYLLLKILSRLFSFLPGRLSAGIGNISGSLFYSFSRKKRLTAFRNVSLAFPGKSHKEILAIVKESFKMFGISVMEILSLPRQVESFDRRLVKIKGGEYLEQAVKEKGIILAVHMGNWELANMVIAEKTPYVVLAKRQKNKALDRILNECRNSKGVESVFEGDLKRLVTYLKKGYVLGIVFDHGSRDSKIYSEFFGKVVPVPAGALRIAKHFNKKIFPTAAKREKGKYFYIEFLKPLEVRTKEDFSLAAGLLNKSFEAFLKQNPEGYLWWYKRFKRSQNLNLLVLDDNKPGHFQQSLRLARLVKAKKKDSLIKTRKIVLPLYKRILLDICCLFSGKRCFGCLRCLKLIMGKQSYELFRYTDIIVSCGSSLSSLNRILSYGAGAKSFIVQKPNLDFKKHDLVVLPYHDRAGKIKNPVRIRGSLVFFEPDELEKTKKEFLGLVKEFNKDKVNLGIFIGGPLSSAADKDKIIKNLEKIKALAVDSRYRLFITTSRRTPGFVEEFLKRELKNSFLVVFNEKNYPFASLGIKAVSDAVMVSSDSVSMITESACLKPTLVFDLFGVSSSPKHVCFIEDLEKNLYIARVKEDNFKERIDDVLKQRLRLKKINNRLPLERYLERKL